MFESLSERLRSLPDLSRIELSDLWRQLFRTASLPKLRRGLMVRILAHRMQELSQGEVSANSRRRLRELTRAFNSNPNGEISSAPGIKPGTRLVREWRGQTHVVTTEDKGYEYGGSRYESLSEIARLITGTRWSGPLFFGLKSKSINCEGQNER